MSHEETIRRAAALKGFLDNEDVDAALKELAKMYYTEFRAADSSEKRVTAWAKANVLEDFLTNLNSVIDAGEMAVLQVAKASASRKP